jgi:predicted ABC-type ATPase
VIPNLDRRPIVVALAGPNGAGKSTFYDLHLSRMGVHFVNADMLSLMTGLNPYEAAEVADSVRRQLLAQGESFIFETVFSDPVGDKIAFLKMAEAAGYTVLLIFIGVGTPEISDQRVAMRVLKGGHDVPSNKIQARYPRVMANLKRALKEVANVQVYDNEDLRRGYRLVASREHAGAVRLVGLTPRWLKDVLS